MLTHYLLIISDDVYPLPLKGPYKTDAHRIRAARRWRAGHGDRDGLYRVTLNGARVIEIDPFLGKELP